MAPGPSDLVADTKIRVEFDSDFTYRFTIQSSGQLRRRERKEAWKAEKRLGEGASGSVWLHRCHVHGGGTELQAVKRINKAKMASQELDWNKELEAIAKFSQRKYDGLFVNYIGWYESDTFVYIAMEYIEHGSLHNHLQESSLPEAEAQEITRQVAEGLCDLHANNFVHRDLKPANILVAQKVPNWWVKIGDFGISKRVHEDTSLRTSVGTRLFMAPETQMIYPPDMDDEMTVNYTERIDIWSLGVVAYYMLLHDYPFTIKNAFLPKYVRGAPLLLPHHVSSQICDFLDGSLAVHSFKRFSAKEALECDWLREDSSRLSVLTDDITRLSVQDQGSEISSASTEETKRGAGASAVDSDLTERRRPEVRESSTVKYAPKSESTGEQIPTHNVSERKAAERIIKKPVPPSSKLQTPAIKSNPPESTHAETEGRYVRDVESWGLDGKVSVGDSSPAREIRKVARDHYNEGVEAFNRKDYIQAEAMFRQALSLYQSSVGSHHVDTLDTQHVLGIALRWTGQCTLAAEHLKEAAEGRRTTLGPTDLATLDSSYQLCVTYWTGKRYVVAEVEFRKLLEVYNEVFGPTSENVNTARVGLAENLAQQGKYDEAEGIFKDVFEWRTEHYGPLNDSTLRVQGAFGVALLNLKKYEQARTVLEAHVKTYREVKGATAPETLFMIHKQGLVFHHLNKTSDAALCFQEVVDYYKNVGETDGDVYLDSLFNLGRTYWLKKDYKKAENILKEAAQGQKAHWGSIDKTFQTLYRLGKTQFKLDKCREASVTFQETIAGETMTVGAKDPRTLNTMYWLAYSFRRLKKYKQAEPLFRKAFEGQKEVLGFVNWDTLESLLAHGEVLYELKRYDDAVEKYRDTVRGWTHYYGPAHEDTLYAMHRLGRAYHKAEQYDEAETTLRSVVKKQKSTAGSSGKKTLSAMDSLGWTLFRMKKFAEGEVVTRELVKRQKRKLGPDAPKTVDATRALGLHLEGQGKVFEAAPLLSEVMLARRKAYGRSHKWTKQSENEYRRCSSKMEESNDYGSDYTHTSTSSVGAEVGFM